MKDLKFRGIYNGNDINVTLRCDMLSNQQDNITVMQVLNGNSFSPNDVNDAVVQTYFSAFIKKKVSLKDLMDHADTYTLDLYISNSDGSGWDVLVNGSHSISESW